MMRLFGMKEQEKHTPPADNEPNRGRASLVAPNLPRYQVGSSQFLTRQSSWPAQWGDRDGKA